MENLFATLEAHYKWLNGKEDGVCATLDDAYFVCANLTGANMTGANMTGANMTGVNLTGADLIRAELVRAILIRADLTDANLIRADLTNANLTGATYRNMPCTRPPVQVSGLRWNVVILDKHIIIGCQMHEATAWRGFEDGTLLKMHPSAPGLWHIWGGTIMALAKAHGCFAEESSDKMDVNHE
jgi:hypothetical protein